MKSKQLNKISFALRGDNRTGKVWIHVHDPEKPQWLRKFDWDLAVELRPEPSQQVYNHSPDGFAWGYAGSGPAQLALAVLLHVTGDAAIAQRFYQSFKTAVIVPLDVDRQLLIECQYLPPMIVAHVNAREEAAV